MIKMFRNVYKAESYLEQTALKKCCKATVLFVIKCETCQEIVCFYHCKDKKKKKSQHLVCYSCFWKD